MGEMDAAERSALMDRARRKAQEDRALSTDIPPTARVLAVSSGKGGVGKSSVTVNLAVALARRGLVVGLLDADIWGFSVPRLLGMQGELTAEGKKIVPLEKPVGTGLLKVVSMGFLADEESAIMWRGLILNRAVQQFLEDVRWGDARLPPHRHAARAPATSRWAWPACFPAPRCSWSPRRPSPRRRWRHAPPTWPARGTCGWRA